MTRDEQGKVIVRWLPDWLYYDNRRMDPFLRRMFPVGSKYIGMDVRPRPGAKDFLLRTIHSSLELDRKWLAAESRAQAQRSRKVLDTQRYIQRVSQEIVEHRRRTNAEIRNDGYLLLTGQEEFVNPITKETERDTNEYQYRWVNPSGEIAYSKDEGYDPNRDPSLTRTDYQRTPVRPRFPQ